jgi:exodeoxyribonuclease V gamma subunit
VDDGVFPRSTRVDGDDILARDPWIGERDARAEDRQLFLDAIASARERLVVLYTGADERTGALRPPAVPLGELLDILDRTAHTSTGPVRDQIVVHHPLQPFDARNFTAGVLGEGVFSFDRAAYDGSTALLAPRAPRPPFLEGPLAPSVSDDPAHVDSDAIVELEALIRFVEHPVRQFLSQRLGLSTPQDDDEALDGLPVDLDGLEKWAIGDRLLEAGLGGIDAGVAVHAEWLRGQLPPGRLGAAVMDPVVEDVAQLVNRSAGLRAGPSRHLDVAINLDGTLLAGTVPGVHGNRVVRVVYSRLAPKHRIRSWVHLLVLVAQFPDEGWEAATVGRGYGGVVLSRLRGVDADQARARLGELITLYREGLCRPLPIPPATAHGYAERRHRGIGPRPSETYAGKAWRSGSGQKQFGDFDDTHHRTVWGEADLAALLAEPPDPADPEWPEEPHRFGQLARRVWSPLLAAEEMHQG